MSVSDRTHRRNINIKILNQATSKNVWGGVHTKARVDVKMSPAVTSEISLVITLCYFTKY